MIGVEYHAAMPNPSTNTRLQRAVGLSLALVFTGALTMLPLAAGAQAPERAPPGDVDAGAGGKGKKAAPDTPKGGPEAGQPGAPQQAKRPPAPRAPQTADEKNKALADLYAQLQTAEDEEAAKRIAASIERLWTFSGSDTVNLLIQRSSKAIKEQKKELAQKLLDTAVDLAPDFTEAFSQRAYFHFTHNNYDAAVGDLRRVLALDPYHYKALEGLAQIWRETGNKRGALRVMQQLLEVHPFASGAKQIYEDLKKEVDGQGI